MTTFSKATVLFLLLALTIVSCKEKEEEPTDSPIDIFRSSIIGDWQSVSPEYDEQGQNYWFRTFSLTEESWSIAVERFVDSAMTVPLFKFELAGPYEITEESQVLPGSYNGTFRFSSKHFTAFIDPVNLGLEDCELEVGVRKDVSNQDCGWIESVSTCPTDYDLVSFENEQLLLGKRTADMCEAEGRPTEKGFPMARI